MPVQLNRERQLRDVSQLFYRQVGIRIHLLLPLTVDLEGKNPSSQGPVQIRGGGDVKML